MKPGLICLVFACTSSTLAAATGQSAVSVRQLPGGSYELTVTVQDTADVGVAQQALVPEAQRICGGQLFRFGHYDFKSTEQVPHDSAPSAAPRVTLRQQLSCGPVAPQPVPHTSYDWTPSAADDRVVATRTQEYLAHKDKGELTLAYGQFSASMKASTGFATWSKGVKAFIAKAGKVDFRKIQKVSWVKDPAGVDPGFYAAVDFSGKFQNIPDECGYVAWYRDVSGQLQIAHEQEGYIDRESETRMTPDELQATLGKIGCVGAPPSPLPESKTSEIGYKNVAEALAALKQMKGASFSTVRGWTIVTDEAHFTVWSFSPQSDPSYPAVVKRTVTSDGAGSAVTMNVLCEADKTSCDTLVREFSDLNARAAGAQPQTH
ncbi:MAG: DUF4019 domain-containing protein [Steroidobacteraceae bacterium]